MFDKLKERLKMDVELGKKRAEKRTSHDFDERAQTNAAMRVVSLVVALTVGALVAAYLLPIGIEEISSTELSNSSDGASALWGILDVMIVLAVFLFFTGIALAASSSL